MASAHLDTFARDHLPPAASQPDYLFELPELQFPAQLNCATELLDNHVVQGRGQRLCIQAQGVNGRASRGSSKPATSTATATSSSSPTEASTKRKTSCRNECGPISLGQPALCHPDPAQRGEGPHTETDVSS